MNDINLTSTEAAALKGQLTIEEFRDVALSLFQKGIVAFDPLLVGTKHSEFSLTPAGRKIALELRHPTP